jgi:hypothetical protein
MLFATKVFVKAAWNSQIIQRTKVRRTRVFGTKCAFPVLFILYNLPSSILVVMLLFPCAMLRHRMQCLATYTFLLRRTSSLSHSLPLQTHEWSPDVTYRQQLLVCWSIIHYVCLKPCSKLTFCQLRASQQTRMAAQSEMRTFFDGL